MDTRRTLLANAAVQLALVLVIAVLVNLLSSDAFSRLDLTRDRIYSLDLTTRSLMYRLERPLVAKVYFTDGLEAQYANHRAVLLDKLEDMRAYSKGLMDIQVADPTWRKDLQEEAERFGVAPIQYRYQSADRAELKQVYMGVAFVYGDRQETIPAVTDLGTLEYELARAVKSLVANEERKTIAYTSGHQEPDLVSVTGPLETLATRVRDRYNLARVPLGGPELLPEDIDALLVIGPQQPLSDRALYQIDQLLMRGGAVGFFITNVKPDMRALRPQNVLHGVEPLLGHYGVQINRDLVIDRVNNGRMPFPVREGRQIVQRSINFPLLPKATVVDQTSLVMKGAENPLFPFVSSLTLADPLPTGVEATVLASSAPEASRLRGIRTLDPTAYQITTPGEEVGSYPLLVALTGTWQSYFASKDVPRAITNVSLGETAVPDDPATRLRESAPTRLVVAGSGDFVANNVSLMLNLVDWMVQDESLTAIRARNVSLPALDPLQPDQRLKWQAFNMLGGTLILLAFGGLRRLSRRGGGEA